MGVVQGGGQIEKENPGCWGSGRPRAAGKPLKEVGGEAPTFLRGFLAARGHPDHQNPEFSSYYGPPISATPMCRLSPTNPTLSPAPAQGTTYPSWSGR